MVTFLSCVASNVVFAGCLALFTLGLTRIWRSPHLAHALWLIVLIKLVTPPIIHVPVDRLIVWETRQSQVVSTSDPSPSSSLPFDGIATTASASVPALATSSVDEPGSDRNASIWNTLVADWTQYLLIAWGIGTVVFIGVGLRRHMKLLPIIADSQAPDAELAKDAGELAQRIGLAKCPPLRVTAAHVCPFVTPGLRTPTVVVPSRLLAELNRDQIKSVVAHELAHIRRRDHWTRVFEVCMLSLNFWNPIAWWASRELQKAKEECCDAWVVWAFPDRARQYAQTLVDAMEFLTGSFDRKPDIATGFGQGTFFKRRIEMIVGKKISRQLSWKMWGVLVIFTLAVTPLSLFGFGTEDETTTSDQLSEADDGATQVAVPGEVAPNARKDTEPKTIVDARQLIVCDEGAIVQIQLPFRSPDRYLHPDSAFRYAFSNVGPPHVSLIVVGEAAKRLDRLGFGGRTLRLALSGRTVRATGILGRTPSMVSNQGNRRYFYTITTDDLEAFEILPVEEPSLTGRWEVISTRWDGNERLEPGAKVGQRTIWEFKTNNEMVIYYIRLREGGTASIERELKGEYELNTSETPWTMDIETFEDRPEMGGGGPRKGIIEVNVNELALCISGTSNGARPKKMESSTDSANILRQMKRVKK